MNELVGADRVAHSDSHVQVFGSYGIPSSACVVAYDSIQRLLLVGTRDGRIKLVGTSAVERTLISNRRNATVSLHVLPNTGCFLRLESCGHLEMWSIRQSGEHVGPARPIEGLQWMPFTVSTADIHIPDDSELQYVTSMQRCDGEFRVLLLHELHTVTAMSLASGENTGDSLQVLAQLIVGSDGVSSDITTMCWANTAADQVLTGHEDGNILLWGISSASFRKLDTYTVVPDDPRAAVTSLSVVLGPHMRIVASGGNAIDVPDSVSLIHVIPSTRTGGGPGAVQHVSHVPWFGKLQGFALVRARGSFCVHDAPSAVITLTEGGYLCIQDIESGRTDPFVGDFQARLIVTSALALIPQSHLRSSVLSMESLREHHSPELLSETWELTLHSGRPCCPGAASSVSGDGHGGAAGVEVLLTGHDNGAVSLWDVRSLTPQRLSHVATSTRPVTTIELDPVTGLLATGHVGGEVNVHVWSPDGPQTDGPHILSAFAWPSSHHSPERKTRGSACWEHALHIGGAKPPLGSSERVVALAIHRQWQSTTVWLAIAFASAGIAVVDLSEGLHCPRWLWQMPLDTDVPGAISFAALPKPPVQQRSRASQRSACEELTLALLVATTDSCLRAYNAADGKPMGNSWMVPKNKEPLLACLPLAADGSHAQSSDDGGASSWLPCADGWMRLPSHSNSQAASTGASGPLPSRVSSAVYSRNSESEAGTGSVSAKAMVPPDAAAHTSGRSGTSAAASSASGFMHEMRHSSRDISQALDASMSSRDGSDALREEEAGGDSSRSDASFEELQEAAAQEDARQRAARSLQKAASGKAATKLKGMLNNASRASARITDKAAIHAKSVADKATMQAKSATRRMSFLRGGQPRQESSEDGGSSRKLPEPIAEGLSPRPKRHSSSELSSPRRPSSLPSSPLSGMISSFSKTAPAPERGHWAMWILVVTKQCVRVYPASAAVTGSRSTSAKYKADGELASGSVVAPPGHPAVAVAWSETSGLHIAKLPALEVAHTEKLEELTGWHWNWADDVVASKHQRERISALPATGLLCMIGPCCELLMLGVERQRPPPLLADAFHDDEVAAAAYSAQAAPSIGRRSSGDSGGGRKSGAGAGPRPGAAGPKPGLQGLLAGLDRKLKDVLQDGGGRSGAGDAAGSAEQWQGALSDAGAQLERLFRSTGPVALLPPQPQQQQHRPATPREASPLASPRAAVPPPRAVSSGTSSRGSAAAPNASAAPVVRSASEIRRAYGREKPAAAQSAAQGTKDVMQDNVARLNERMERLRGIEDRANDLAKDAEDFHSMAKKLNKEAERPWWKPF